MFITLPAIIFHSESYYRFNTLDRYDLMIACKEIGEGKRAVPELLGDVVIKPISAADAYVKKLESKRVNNEQIIALLGRYAARKTFRQTKALAK